MRGVVLLALAACGGSDALARWPDHRTPVDRLELTQAAEIDDDAQPDQLVFAPDGSMWASGDYNGLTVRQGDHQVARYDLRDSRDATIGFSSDGKTFHVGMADLDPANGALAMPKVPDLVAWAASKGYPAPPTLSFVSVRKSDDGKLVVVSANGTTRDRRTGLQKAKTGNNDWLFALEGTTATPIAVLWTTRDAGMSFGAFSSIAISDRFVAACGFAGLYVFAREALDKPIDLGGVLRAPNRVVWNADGSLLAAASTDRTLAIWRAGAWTAPAAKWDLPENGGAIAFDPARPLLAVGGADGHVRIYKIDDAALASPTVIADQVVGGQVMAVAWSPDGANLLVAATVPQGKIFRFAVTVSP